MHFQITRNAHQSKIYEKTSRQVVKHSKIIRIESRHVKQLQPAIYMCIQHLYMKLEGKNHL